MSELVSTIYRATGKELPKKWAENAGIDSDEVVQITVTPEREILAAELSEIMDEAAAEAKKNGLTEKKLDELLYGA